MAKELKKRDISVVYYISPQIWAWKEYRIKQIKDYVDEMLVLFSFEKDFYNERNVSVHFVGHPLLDELKSEFLNKEQIQLTRSKYGFEKGRYHIGSYARKSCL